MYSIVWAREQWYSGWSGTIPTSLLHPSCFWYKGRGIIPEKVCSCRDRTFHGRRSDTLQHCREQVATHCNI